MKLGEMFPTKGPALGEKSENVVLVQKSRGERHSSQGALCSRRSCIFLLFSI